MGLAVKDGAGLPETLKSRLDGSDQVVAHDTIPFAKADLLWLVLQPMDVDTNYASVDCQRFGTVWLEFVMEGDFLEEGELFIEWSLDDNTFYPFAIDFGKWSSRDLANKLTVTEAEGKVAVAPLTTKTRFSLGIEKPPPFMRGRWFFISGGDAFGMTGKNFGRG